MCASVRTWIGRVSRWNGLAGAEGLFDLRQILVAVMHFLPGNGAHREICLDHITAIELGGLFASGRVHTQHQSSPLYFDLQPSIDLQLLDPGAHRLLCGGHGSARMLTEIAISLDQQLFHAGLFVGSRKRYFLGTNRIAPQHVTHPILRDLAHCAVNNSICRMPAFKSVSICGLVMAVM